MPLVQIRRRLSANRSIDPPSRSRRTNQENTTPRIETEERRGERKTDGRGARERENARVAAARTRVCMARKRERERERRGISQAPRHIRSIYFPDSLLSSCPPGCSRFLAAQRPARTKKDSLVRICTASAIIPRALLDPGRSGCVGAGDATTLLRRRPERKSGPLFLLYRPSSPLYTSRPPLPHSLRLVFRQSLAVRQ